MARAVLTEIVGNVYVACKKGFHIRDMTLRMLYSTSNFLVLKLVVCLQPVKPLAHSMYMLRPNENFPASVRVLFVEVSCYALYLTKSEAWR